jgi:hypothetical protein
MQCSKVKLTRVVGLLALFPSLSLFSLAQVQFVGRWQTKLSPVTQKHNITVNIAVTEDKLGGTIVLVNPDLSEIELPILNGEVKGDTFMFKTNDQGNLFEWWLVTTKNRKWGILHGSDRRPAKGGQSGEMLIEEKVNKQ